MSTTFTSGGVCKFINQDKDVGEEFKNSRRDGFIGWMGAGGSILQWHPELKIGFGYNPFDHNYLENGHRGSKI